MKALALFLAAGTAIGSFYAPLRKYPSAESTHITYQPSFEYTFNSRMVIRTNNVLEKSKQVFFRRLSEEGRRILSARRKPDQETIRQAFELSEFCAYGIFHGKVVGDNQNDLLYTARGDLVFGKDIIRLNYNPCE